MFSQPSLCDLLVDSDLFTGQSWSRASTGKFYGMFLCISFCRWYHSHWYGPVHSGPRGSHYLCSHTNTTVHNEGKHYSALIVVDVFFFSVCLSIYNWGRHLRLVLVIVCLVAFQHLHQMPNPFWWHLMFRGYLLCILMKLQWVHLTGTSGPRTERSPMTLQLNGLSIECRGKLNLLTKCF